MTYKPTIPTAYTVEIETTNDAFASDPAAEIARVLRDCADKLEKHGVDGFRLHDSNGNRVGRSDFRD